MSLSYITNKINMIDNIENTDIDNIEVDDIDYGISLHELAAKYNNIVNGVDNGEIKEDEKLNPFYVSTTGGNLKTLGWGDIYRNYNSVVILTISNNNHLNKTNGLDNIFKYIIKRDAFQNNKDFTYFRTSLNILKNKDHYFKTIIITKDNLLELFPNGIFNESELVLGIYEMDEENTRKYCDFYKNDEYLQDVEQKLDMFKYYIGNNTRINMVNTNNLLLNLKDVDYWQNKINLNLNITDSFVNREFNNDYSDKRIFTILKLNEQNYNVNDINIQNAQIKKKAEDSQNPKKVFSIKKGGADYPINEINQQNQINDNSPKKNNFIDPSNSILSQKDGNKRNFYLSYKEQKYTNEYVCNMFNLITDDKVKYIFLNDMLCSKEYCHLIINNKSLLEETQELFQKYKPVFKYTFGYAWLTFYLEECISRTRTTKKSRFVFDINTASKLPVFPYVLSDLKQNPYMTVLIDDAELVLNNSYGMEYKENYDGYGVCDLETFQKRLNMFTSEDPNCDPLKGINWNNFAISGSAITACLQKKSLLYDMILKNNHSDNKENIENDSFIKYVRKYYGESDIDLMSNQSSFTDFLESVQQIYNLLKLNLNAEETDRYFETVKSCGISITEHFFTTYLEDFNKTFNLQVTLDEFEKMIDTSIFKIFVYNKYIENKNILTARLINKKVDITNKFVNSYITPNSFESINIYKVEASSYLNYSVQDTDLLYYQNDFIKDENKPKLSEKDNQVVIKFSENIRFKLFCKKTKIETFRIKEKDFFNTVARFHLPCVRAYYQGDNVYILPSCITSMMTGLNIEYKYFAGIRNPTEIINKYMGRGFGVILNKFERNLMVEYNKSINIHSDTLLGPKLINNQIYKFDDSYVFNHDMYNIDKFKNYYHQKNKNSCIDITKMTTINKNGDINKYKKAFVELYYDEIN